MLATKSCPCHGGGDRSPREERGSGAGSSPPSGWESQGGTGWPRAGCWFLLVLLPIPCPSPYPLPPAPCSLLPGVGSWTSKSTAPGAHEASLIVGCWPRGHRIWGLLFSGRPPSRPSWPSGRAGGHPWRARAGTAGDSETLTQPAGIWRDLSIHLAQGSQTPGLQDA